MSFLKKKEHIKTLQCCIYSLLYVSFVSHYHGMALKKYHYCLVPYIWRRAVHPHTHTDVEYKEDYYYKIIIESSSRKICSETRDDEQTMMWQTSVCNVDWEIFLFEVYCFRFFFLNYLWLYDAHNFHLSRTQLIILWN